MDTVFLTGATGYVGKRLLIALKQKGFKLKCLVRKAANIKDCELVYGDIKDKDLLEKSLKEVKIVIHLAAITTILDQNISDVNVVGTKNLIEASKKNKVSLVIYISSTSAVSARDIYGKTKKQAEELISKSGLKYVILRPGVIYSKDSPFILKIINLNKKIPFFAPIIGNGKYIINPAHIDDVISAILSAVNNKNALNKTYYILGPKNIKFNYFIDTINKAYGIKRRKLHIPIVLCTLIAFILEKLINKPYLTMSTINALKANPNYSIEEAKKDLNYNPISFQEGIKK